MMSTVPSGILRENDNQQKDDQSRSSMPPENPSSQPLSHHGSHTHHQLGTGLPTDSTLSGSTAASMGDPPQHGSGPGGHSAHSIEHSMAEHAAHSMLDLHETGSSLEHLAGAGGGHGSQSIADQAMDSGQNQQSQQQRNAGDRLGSLGDGSHSLGGLGNGDARDLGRLGSSGSGSNGLVNNRPMSVLGGATGLTDRSGQPMRNMTPGLDSRHGLIPTPLNSDGRPSSLSGAIQVSRAPSVGPVFPGDHRGSSTPQPGLGGFNPEQSSQSLLDSISSRGRPPSLGHHSLDHRSLPPHMRGLSDHHHSHLLDHHHQQHQQQQQSIGEGGNNSSSHNGHRSTSGTSGDLYGLSAGSHLNPPRPGSILPSDVTSSTNSNNINNPSRSASGDAHDLSRSVYSSSSSASSSDRPPITQVSTSLIEETIAAVASNFGKNPDIGGPLPGHHTMMSHLGALGVRTSSAHHGLGGHDDGTNSLADLASRHPGLPMPGLMDDHGGGLTSGSTSPGASHGMGRGSAGSSQLEKTHPCLTCLKMFRSKQQLAQHSLVHTNIRKHICSYCDRAFKQLSHLQQHIRIHTGERKYTCPVCDRAFKQLSHLQKHIRIHTGERKYICSFCEKGFKQLSHLQQHFRIHTDERKYVCSICEKGFKQLSHLQQHFRIHTGERKYVCQVCSRAFKQMTHLQQHIRIHTGERKYVCQICNRAFKQMTHLQQHHIIHTGERKFVCQICNRAFKQMTHLQQHHKIHTGERKYVCQCCDRAFKQLTHLQQHYRIHTDERKYVCQCCDKAFRQLSHLNQHFRIHTGEKPYRCKFENCERAFAQLSNLQHHMRNHDDQVKKEATRIHKCQICHRCYTNESSLKSHTLKMHIHIKPIDQHSAPIPKKRRKKKNKDLYGGAPTMVPVSSSGEGGGFGGPMGVMKGSMSRPRSPTSSDEDEIIFMGEQMGPPRVDNFPGGSPSGPGGPQGQGMLGQGSSSGGGSSGGRTSHGDLSHQMPFSSMSNFSRSADPLALLASANRFTLQDNMMGGLGGPLNSFSDQLAFRDAALLNSRFGDLRSGQGGSGFDDRFPGVGNFNQQQQNQHQQRGDRDSFGNHTDLNNRSSGGNNTNGSAPNSNTPTPNTTSGTPNNNAGGDGMSGDNRGMLRGSGMGGMMAGGPQGLSGLMKQIKQEPLDYFPSSCHGGGIGDQFGSGMGSGGGAGGFLSPQHLLNSHLRGQLPSLNVPLIREHFGHHNQMLPPPPHSSSSAGGGTGSGTGGVSSQSSSSSSAANLAPSSTSSTSLASSTPSSLASLHLPLSHMGLYHQGHFSSSQRMGGLHPSPASTPSQLSAVSGNLPSNLTTQGGRSPLEQEDLRCFSPLRN